MYKSTLVPLIILTIGMTIGFMDGAFMWYLPDGLYLMVGLGFIGSLGYLWYLEQKNSTLNAYIEHLRKELEKTKQ